MSTSYRGPPNRNWQFVFVTGASLVAIAILGGATGQFTVLHAAGLGLIGVAFVLVVIKKRSSRPWRTRPRSNSR